MSDLITAQKEILESLQNKEKLNNEEFKIWKKTVPLLYDTIQFHAIDNVVFSSQWLPNYQYSDDKNTISIRAVVGGSNLSLVLFLFPSTLASDFPTVLPNSQGVPIPLFSAPSATNGFKVIKPWKSSSEINKIKVSPDGTKFVAFDKAGIIHLYSVLEDTPKNGNEQEGPVASFKYHKAEGTALEWIDDSKFLSGAKDSQIALWDISKPLTPIQVYKAHTATINSISSNGGNLFVSAADDYTTQVHDLTTSSNSAIKYETSHIQHTVSFHPEVQTLYLSGGEDNVITLYDLRNPGKEIRRFFGHIDSVIGVEWDKFNEPSVFQSWGLDKRVLQWNISSIDEDFVYPTSDEPVVSTGPGPKRKAVGKMVDPCLKFVHGSHTGRINDVAFHPKIKRLVLSSGSDNLLEVWKSKTVFEDFEDEEEEEEEK